MTLQPRAIVVSRPTELTELLERHGTRGQIEFFLSQRGQSLDPVERRHGQQELALAEVDHQIPPLWRRSHILRSDLDRWMFEPEDVIIVVGQDGLVANVAKYLEGQPVIGVNPSPDESPGILVRHRADRLGAVIERLMSDAATIQPRAMVEAVSDDGQTLRALNEVFVGTSSHQSARYEITVGERSERQSSSGLIVGTGTGATGWCASLWNDRRPDWKLPEPDSADLAWFVREAWPSAGTGTCLTSGLVKASERLTLRCESDSLVVFGDGIEPDHLELGWGQSLDITLSPTTLHLCV